MRGEEHNEVQPVAGIAGPPPRAGKRYAGDWAATIWQDHPRVRGKTPPTYRW
ncbi:hypothetical protein [Catenuloplanes japonicus]|uniref:hypothetical protein n=1 Tax=Catenuloplanes japonicus TaxID=33876 RepID=UPI000A88D609|nr:hypothetical protein [Catenuloplanes japonicus]